MVGSSPREMRLQFKLAGKYKLSGFELPGFKSIVEFRFYTCVKWEPVWNRNHHHHFWAVLVKLTYWLEIYERKEMLIMMLDAYSLLRCRYLLIPTSLVDIVNNTLVADVWAWSHFSVSTFYSLSLNPNSNDINDNLHDSHEVSIKKRLLIDVSSLVWELIKWAILENIHTQPRTASMF